MESNDDADADPANIFPQLILILVLTLINAFFASAEMAVISANKNKIRRLASEGNKKAQAVEKLCKNETKFLSTIQVGITLAGFFSSATAALTLSESLGELLEKIKIPYSEQVATILVTLLLSFVTLIFGELYPKRVALKDPEKKAMNSAKALLIIKFIATPFVKLLTATTNLVVKITGVERGIKEEKVSDNDIIDVVNSGVEEGTVDEDKSKMIESTLKFYHLSGTDLMTPRVDVFMIDVNEPISENMPKILEEKYTRIPIYDSDKDNVIGILNMKDILKEGYEKGFKNLELKQLLRKPFFVHEYIDANELFKKMKDSNEQIACLMDEFGGFSGIVTMEDLVEEIVGNIKDEYDEDEFTIQSCGHNQYIVKGTLPIHEINQELEINLDEENTEYDTIAGLIVMHIDRIPSQNDKIEFEIDGVHIKVLEIIGKRINKVLIEIKEQKNVA